jgi:hypothetical protein
MAKEVRPDVSDYGVDRYLIRFIPDLAENNAGFSGLRSAIPCGFFELRNFFCSIENKRLTAKVSLVEALLIPGFASIGIQENVNAYHVSPGSSGIRSAGRGVRVE